MEEKYSPTPEFHEMMTQFLMHEPRLIEIMEQQYINHTERVRYYNQVKRLMEEDPVKHRDEIQASFRQLSQALLTWEQFMEAFQELRCTK